MKKQLSFFALLALLGSFMLSLEGCKDTTTSPVNPCEKEKALTANFKVEEDFDFVAPGWRYYATDTVSSTVVRFTALDSLCDKYEWKIGAGSYEKRSFKLYFPASFLNSEEVVEVTLTVHKSPRKCFPKDDSIKSFTKAIYFANLCNGLYKASFNGYLEEDPSKKFTIKIDPCNMNRPNPDNPALIENAFRIDGFPQNCAGKTYILSYNSLSMYRQFSFGGDGCYFPGGYGKIQNDKKTLIIDYQAQKFASPPGKPAPQECIEQVKHKFVGVRVN